MLRQKEDMKEWQVEALPKEEPVKKIIHVSADSAPEEKPVEKPAEKPVKKAPAKKKPVKKVEKMPVE